jgi:arsenate reductase-like glutaredoxin family protein
MIPKASSELPENIIELITQTGKAWKEFNKSNLFDRETLKHWHELVQEWSTTSDLPLIVRNSKFSRGSIVLHVSGREIAFCDNTTACWVAEKVFEKEKPSLTDIKRMLQKDEIPFKFAAAKGEQDKAKYKCISKNRLNKAGWKLCHIEGVGLNDQKDIIDMDLEIIKRKFILLLDPNNFFILPKEIGGLGEVEWFINSQC